VSWYFSRICLITVADRSTFSSGSDVGAACDAEEPLCVPSLLAEGQLDGIIMSWSASARRLFPQPIWITKLLACKLLPATALSSVAGLLMAWSCGCTPSLTPVPSQQMRRRRYRISAAQCGPPASTYHSSNAAGGVTAGEDDDDDDDDGGGACAANRRSHASPFRNCHSVTGGRDDCVWRRPPLGSAPAAVSSPSASAPSEEEEEVDGDEAGCGGKAAIARQRW
jgi:hypothetical protein